MTRTLPPFFALRAFEAAARVPLVAQFCEWLQAQGDQTDVVEASDLEAAR
ncbi:hypothetical protein [Paraburkholderia caffeinilytica]